MRIAIRRLILPTSAQCGGAASGLFEAEGPLGRQELQINLTFFISALITAAFGKPLIMDAPGSRYSMTNRQDQSVQSLLHHQTRISCMSAAVRACIVPIYQPGTAFTS